MRLPILFLLLSLPLLAAEEPLEIPADDPVRLEAVHNLAFSYEGALQVDALGGYFYGDRFLSSLGAGASAYYYLSQTFAVGGEGFIFSNSIDPEAQPLTESGVIPRLSNPDLLVRAAVIWQPLYGKFNVAGGIQRFFWNIGLGIHMARETVYKSAGYFAPTPDPTPAGNTDLRFGPNISTRLIFPFWERWNVTLNFAYYLHQGTEFGSSAISKKMWLANIGVGIRL